MAKLTAEDPTEAGLVVACMSDSPRDPVPDGATPVWLIEAVWDAGGVHSIIQADAASRRGLTQVLALTPNQ